MVQGSREPRRKARKAINRRKPEVYGERQMQFEKCEKCFHFHHNAQECFKHNIPRHSSDRCSEYSKQKKK